MARSITRRLLFGAGALAAGALAWRWGLAPAAPRLVRRPLSIPKFEAGDGAVSPEAGFAAVSGKFDGLGWGVRLVPLEGPDQGFFLPTGECGAADAQPHENRRADPTPRSSAPTVEWRNRLFSKEEMEEWRILTTCMCHSPAFSPGGNRLAVQVRKEGDSGERLLIWTKHAAGNGFDGPLELAEGLFRGGMRWRWIDDDALLIVDAGGASRVQVDESKEVRRWNWDRQAVGGVWDVVTRPRGEQFAVVGSQSAFVLSLLDASVPPIRFHKIAFPGGRAAWFFSPDGRELVLCDPLRTRLVSYRLGEGGGVTEHKLEQHHIWYIAAGSGGRVAYFCHAFHAMLSYAGEPSALRIFQYPNFEKTLYFQVDEWPFARSGDLRWHLIHTAEGRVDLAHIEGWN